MKVLKYLGILLLVFLFFGCSKDEDTTTGQTITGLGFFDNETYDYVFFIESSEKTGLATEDFESGEIGNAWNTDWSIVNTNQTRIEGNFSIKSKDIQNSGYKANEDFETGTLSDDWTGNGEYGWSIDSSTSSEGNFSLRSGEIPDSYYEQFAEGVIPDNWTTDWEIDSLNTVYAEFSAKSNPISDGESTGIEVSHEAVADGEIYFLRKVSSEEDHDFLVFYIDGNEQERWSGEKSWASFTYPVEAGSHTYKWIYEKDGAGSDSLDCAWIESIYFPQSISEISIDVDCPTDGEISFDMKVSSEATYDGWDFYIGDERIDNFSGITGWMHRIIPISAGFYKFTWKFRKNEINSFGDDCAWLDNIKFPQSVSEIFLTYDMPAAGSVSFFKKVSSEVDNDFLKFYIDREEIAGWSGEEDWDEYTSPNLAAGIHTFKWTYVKDKEGSSGSDCAWIDQIVFPEIVTPAKDMDNVASFAVIKENTFMDSVFIVVDGEEYEMDDLSGGRLWSGGAFIDEVTNENETHSFEITGYGRTLVDSAFVDITLNKSFTLKNVNFIADTYFPLCLYNTEYDLYDTWYTNPDFVAQDAFISWEVPSSNNYQIVSVSESAFATPDDYEIEVDASTRSYTVSEEAYDANPRKVNIRITELNAVTSGSFAAYSAYKITRYYDYFEDATKSDDSILNNVLSNLKFIKNNR